MNKQNMNVIRNTTITNMKYVTVFGQTDFRPGYWGCENPEESGSTWRRSDYFGNEKNGKKFEILRHGFETKKTDTDKNYGKKQKHIRKQSK